MDLFHFQLGQHPFVREGLRLEDSSLILALTSNLTESQELAKENIKQVLYFSSTNTNILFKLTKKPYNFKIKI